MKFPLKTFPYERIRSISPPRSQDSSRLREKFWEFSLSNDAAASRR
jgi:hypothetical protein